MSERQRGLRSAAGSRVAMQVRRGGSRLVWSAVLFALVCLALGLEAAANDAPTASNRTVTTDEDTAYTFGASDFDFQDTDAGDELASVRIMTLPRSGSLTNNDVAVTTEQVIAKAEIDANNLVFTPAADANGAAYASFTFKVNDGTEDSASAYTMTVNVTAVQDAPTARDGPVSTNEDTAYVFMAGDFNFEDADMDELASVRIVTLPDSGSLANEGLAVTAGQVIATADIDANDLVFTPAADANGAAYASFTFKVNDGTEDSTSAYTMTVNVTAVNDAPTASDGTVTTNEDTPYTFTQADFRFEDVDTGDGLASVRIVTRPLSGSLTNDNAPVRQNQEVSRADIDSGKLVFTPVPDANGAAYASFTFKVNDGTDDSASAYTMTIDVTSVPDAPAASDGTATTTEDTPYTFTVEDFNFRDGDEGDELASVTIVTLPGSEFGSLTDNGVDVTVNEVITRAEIEANRLVFTPARNANGDPLTSFTFTVNDGTQDSTLAYTMAIDVFEANDPPTASGNKVTTAEDTAYTFTQADFRFEDIDSSDELASVKIVTRPLSGSLTNDNEPVRENQEVSRADIDSGRLVFTPVVNANGDPYTSFTFKVNDGTQDSISTYTMTIAVTEVNDAPTAGHGEVTTLEDTDYVFAAHDFNFRDVEAGDTLSSVRIVTLPGSGSLTNAGTGVTPNQEVSRADIDAGRLVFAPAANAHGNPYTSFTFRVRDGERESATIYTMTIVVISTVETATLHAWNARLGRAIGGQVVDAVTARFESAGGSRVTLGGKRIGGSALGDTEGEAGFADRLDWVRDAADPKGPRATSGMTGKELLRDSAFHLAGGEAGEGGSYAVWGQLAVGGFEARADGMKLDGEVTMRLLGVDGEWGRVLAGVAVARSESEGGLQPVAPRPGGGGQSTIETGLTGIYPYARLAFGNELAAWALVGYGAGRLTLLPEDEERFETRVAMQIGALGVKGRILNGERLGGVRMSVKSDAMWVHAASDGARGLNEARGDARRLRLTLEADREFEAGELATLTPSGEIGLRHDGGDADSGAGLEVGGGFRYAVGGFTAEARARLLVSHDATGHKEWGASGSLALSPDALGRGLSYSFRPVWGWAESGTGAFWSLDTARDLATERSFEAEGRLEARLGYGFAAFGDRLTATPELGMGIAESHRRFSLGWRLEHARRERVDFDLLFEATRRGSDGRQPQYGLGVRGSMRW